MNQDFQIIQRYVGQPGELPRDLRAQVEHAWDGAPVLLYALGDLDARLRLSESWLILGERQVALAHRAHAGAPWSVRHVERARITGVQESPGLSANALVLLGEPDAPPLLVLRYTQRQRGA